MRRSEARTSDTASPSMLLGERDEGRDRLASASAARFRCRVGERDRARSAAPCVIDLNGLPSKSMRGGHPEAVDRVGQQQHLDAAGAKPFELRRGLEPLESSPAR